MNCSTDSTESNHEHSSAYDTENLHFADNGTFQTELGELEKLVALKENEMDIDEQKLYALQLLNEEKIGNALTKEERIHLAFLKERDYPQILCDRRRREKCYDEWYGDFSSSTSTQGLKRILP